FEMPFQGLVPIWDGGLYVSPAAFRAPAAARTTPAATGSSAPTSFDAALTRLVDAGPSRFANLRGAPLPREPDDDATFYQLAMSVPGLSDCVVQVVDDTTTSPSVTCRESAGDDDAVLMQRYRQLADRVSQFATARGSTASETTRDSGSRVRMHI